MHTLSAKELRDRFVRGDVKAVEIARHFLKRVENHNKHLGAFLSVLEKRVMKRAEALDAKRTRGERLGKLAGIPIAIKDNTHIEGEATTCASKILQGYKAPFSATAVEKLEAEDALLIGKANLDEFAMGSTSTLGAFGAVHNPWDLKKVAGGSSGGSAAAVAARLSLLSTGSDTGGSIRLPAAFTGLVGFKPTYGRVSRHGLVAYGSSLDQIGPFGVNVEDVALAMEVMGSYCPHDATSLDLPSETYPLSKTLEKDTVIGVPWKLIDTLKGEVRTNFEESLEVMKKLGAKIVEVDLDILKYSIAVYYILATAEASTNLARFDGVRYGHRAKDVKSLDAMYDLSRCQGFGVEVKRRIMLGTYVLSAGYQDAYYKKAQKVRTLILDAFDKAFSACDAVMMPVSTNGAFRPDAKFEPLELYLQDIFTVPANLAGLPAVSVPSGYDKEGMPLGVQILGAQMCDVAVLQYAYAYEQATKFARIPEGYDA